MTDLQQIEQIKRLKYRCFRTLDQKDWTKVAECFAEDTMTNLEDKSDTHSMMDMMTNFHRR